MNTTWSVRIERLRTQLRVGVHDDELLSQPVWVTLRLRGVSPACPTKLSDCIDYEPLCRWITEEWPCTPHIPLLENRVNELIAFAFEFDPRVQEVHVGLAKERVSRLAASIGIERSVLREEFEAQRRQVAPAAASRPSSEWSCDEHQTA